MPAGDFYTEHVWHGLAPEAAVADRQRIGLGASHVPVLVFWNRGKNEEVYFVRYRGGVRFQHGGINSEASVTFRRVV